MRACMVRDILLLCACHRPPLPVARHQTARVPDKCARVFSIPQMEFHDRPQRISGVITARSFGSHHAHQASRVLAYEDRSCNWNQEDHIAAYMVPGTGLSQKTTSTKSMLSTRLEPDDRLLGHGDDLAIALQGGKTNGAAYQKSADTGVC